MNARIEMLLDRYVVQKIQKRFRREKDSPYALAEDFHEQGLSGLERSVKRLTYMLEQERPVVFKDERIGLIRTVPVNYEIFTEDEWKEIKKDHYIHEQGKVCNINPRYGLLLDRGFDAVRREIERQKGMYALDGQGGPSAQGTGHGFESESLRYLNALTETLDAIEAFAGRYGEEAQRAGNPEMARVFGHIPKQRPGTFMEALQVLRLLHYCLWCSFNYHNTFGRFDQYMYPYYKADMESGRLTKEEALELLEEFFISCNKDSDLYPGMQQGDNGQSMVLGGLNPDGSDSFNELSDLCLQASLELKLIDPKINLRVNKDTPLARYERGTQLTRQGLGFPQYANDDVVIPCLRHWGYAEKDAYDYVVAACWEFIIPGTGMDIPNVNGLSLSLIHI